MNSFTARKREKLLVSLRYL